VQAFCTSAPQSRGSPCDSTTFLFNMGAVRRLEFVREVQGYWKSLFFGVIQSITYDFLPVFYSNYASILQPFLDTITYLPKFRKVT